MGEYVKASEIRPGDYVSSWGAGYEDRLVVNILGCHQRSRINNGPWQDIRMLDIQCGSHAKGPLEGMLKLPDDLVYRRHKRPTVNITDDNTVVVNGVLSGEIRLEADKPAHEYNMRHMKDEILGGATGYVWYSYDITGKFTGKAISYDSCLQSIIRRALRAEELLKEQKELI